MSYVGYKGALEAAGAVVHIYESFGSYQGDWWALVSINGQKGWINGSYGSCSGCDAFEAEFGWSGENCEDHKYCNVEESTDCNACKHAKQVYKKKLRQFGAGYLDGIMSQDEAEKRAGEHISWDSDAETMLKFVRDHAFRG